MLCRTNTNLVSTEIGDDATAVTLVAAIAPVLVLP